MCSLPEVILPAMVQVSGTVTAAVAEVETGVVSALVVLEERIKKENRERLERRAAIYIYIYI